MTEDYTTVRTHVNVWKRHWLLLMVFLVLGVAAGIVLSPKQQVTYSATTEVLVPNLLGTSLSNQTVTDQIKIAQSDLTVDAVIDNLHLDMTRTQLLSKVLITNDEDTGVLNITASGSDRAQIAAIANEFGAAYLAAVDDQVTSVTASLKAYYEGQLASINQQILQLRALLPTQNDADQLTTQTTLTRLQSRAGKINSALGLVEVPPAPPKNGRVLLKAAVPPRQVPSKLREILLGLTIGMLIGLAVIYTVDRRDDSVREEDDLGDALNGSLVLGRVPVDRTARRGALAVTSGGKEAVVEAYRALATNLRFLVGGRLGRSETAHRNVVVVTSAVAAEGKTSVAANLAVTAARMGQRVILVDADLRQPGVATLFGLSGETGLAEVLAGGESGVHLLRDVGIANLRVLVAGASIDNSADLLASPQTETLLRELARDADLVVVDTAPLLPVADTLALASTADHVVLVMRRGKTKARQLRSALERMALVGVTPSGAVLTAVPTRMVTGGYHVSSVATDAPSARAAGA